MHMRNQEYLIGKFFDIIYHENARVLNDENTYIVLYIYIFSRIEF